MKKKNLKNNKDNIFITDGLTKFRQSIIKELNTQKKAKKKSSPLKLLSQSQPNFAEMILGWSSSKIVSGISEHRPR
jgi:hypothetical protein